MLKVPRIADILFIFCLLFFSALAAGPAIAESGLAGRILLEVERNGEAWYWDPAGNQLHFLGRPADAFLVMRQLSLGISNHDFDEIKNNPPARFLGQVLLKTEDKGEAWYVYPGDRKLYFLGRPDDAFRVMRELGLGVSALDFEKIKKERSAAALAGKNQSPPFTAQAPFGEWSNQRFQDGCEEASVLMAAAWAKGFSFDFKEAREMILALSDFAGRELGEWRDQSIADTARLLEKYYDYDKYEIFEGSVEKIIEEIRKGKVVIAPFDGRKLGNPYFTAPGPVHHMMLIHGYDEATSEFIAHDPGTRQGRNYRYKKTVIDSAWRDYPTGYHEDFENIKKTMIAIGK